MKKWKIKKYIIYNIDEFQSDTNRENNNNNLIGGQNLGIENQNFEVEGEGEREEKFSKEFNELKLPLYLIIEDGK